jgi:hypothetical protein
MAYSETLALRARKTLAHKLHGEERRMFGSFCPSRHAGKRKAVFKE